MVEQHLDEVIIQQQNSQRNQNSKQHLNHGTEENEARLVNTPKKGAKVLVPTEFRSEQTESHESQTLSAPKHDSNQIQVKSLFQNQNLQVQQSEPVFVSPNLEGQGGHLSPQLTDIQAASSKGEETSVDRSSKSQGMGFFVTKSNSQLPPAKGNEFASKKQNLQLNSSSSEEDSDLKTDRRMRSDFEQHMKSAVKWHRNSQKSNSRNRNGKNNRSDSIQGGKTPSSNSNSRQSVKKRKQLVQEVDNSNKGGSSTNNESSGGRNNGGGTQQHSRVSKQVSFNSDAEGLYIPAGTPPFSSQNKEKRQQPQSSQNLVETQNSLRKSMQIIQKTRSSKTKSKSKRLVELGGKRAPRIENKIKESLTKYFQKKVRANVVQLKADQREKQEKAGEIRRLINEKQEESSLSLVWSKIILLIHTYNFFTIFFFLGIEGFPTSFWLLFEILSEILIIFDFFMRLFFRTQMPEIWKEMWLLHDKGSKSVFHLIIRLFGSIPQSLILCLIFRKDLSVLTAFPYALLRLLKLLRLRQISQYFEKVDFNNRRSVSKLFLSVFMVIYYFFLATHFIGCMWLLVARLDQFRGQSGWFKMANYDNYEVTIFQKYLESLFFVVATMTGLGYGNIVPSTNLEWLVDSFIMIMGASLYANFFAAFAVEIYKNNKSQIDNDKKLEQAERFAEQRLLPLDLRHKIKTYYQSMRRSFLEFQSNYEILDRIPHSLSAELSLLLNRQLIQEVKFFQLAQPDFISKISDHLRPNLSISGEYVVRQGEVAERWYFIHSGIVEIIASDDQSTIAYQSSGCYFGEIGCLITQKRSCSVKVKESAILYYIQKADLLKILDHFPRQAKFLRAVARQRLETTHSEDLQQGDSAPMIEFEMKFIQDPEFQDEKYSSTTQILNAHHESINQKSSLVKSFTMKQGGQQDQPTLQRTTRLPKTNSFLSKQDSIVEMYLRQSSRRMQNSRLKVHFWQTNQYNDFDGFLIVPFSHLFTLWNSILVLSIAFEIFMVPFSISLSYDSLEGFYFEDALVCAIFTIDIYMRSKTAILTPHTLSFDTEVIFHAYVNSYLIFDILACLPFEYFLLPFATESMYLLRYLRLFRLLKVGRLHELIKLIRFQSNFPNWLLMFMQLVAVFLIAAHSMACTYILIGQNERNQKSRFDGQYLFGDMTNRNFITLSSASEMGPFELYIQFLYLSSCTMGAVMYGDVIPYTLAEQLFTFVAMFGARIYLAFVFAEAASYLSQIHIQKSAHNQKMQRIQSWMNQNNFPSQLTDRVKGYHMMLWENFRGIDEAEILEDLPESLRADIRQQILKNLINNWEAFPRNPKQGQGILQTLLKMLKLNLIPQHEYIIRFGQLAEDMYFIVKGICKVQDQKGKQIAILKQGQNFGEMALLDRNLPLRGASVISVTKCSLAILTKKDFDLLCEIFPEFKLQIFDLARRRRISNTQREKRNTIIEQQTTNLLGIVQEEDDGSLQTDKDKSVTYEESSISKESVVTENSRAKINQEEQSQPQTNSPKSKFKELERPANSAQIMQRHLNEDLDKIEKGLNCQDQKMIEMVMVDAQSGDQRQQSQEMNGDSNRSPSTDEKNKKSPAQTLSPRSISNDTPAAMFQGEGSGQVIVEDEDLQFTDRPNQEERNQLLDSKQENKKEQKIVRFSERNQYEPQIKSQKILVNPFNWSKRKNLGKVTPEGILSNEVDEDKSLDSSMISRRDSILYPNVESYITESKKGGDDQEHSWVNKNLNLENMLNFIVLLLAIYNIFFVPLSFGFRIKFKGVFLTLEVLTIFFYLIEIVVRGVKLNQLNMLENISDLRLNQSERRLKNDPEMLAKEKRYQRIEIVLSCISALPLVSFFNFLELYQPWLLVNTLSGLRLVKISPILRFFDFLKHYQLNFWRILEAITFYIFIVHFMTCLLLSGVAFEEDARENWLRRIPVPQDDGIRMEKSVFTDMTPFSIYVHSFYFVVNTVSHVAIGDITSVTTEERALNAFIILCGTFIYSFLFGNITAIVSSLAPSQHSAFYQKFNRVTQKIVNGKTPLKNILEVNRFFDFQWSLYNGLDFEKALNQLPDSIKYDVLMSQYQDTIETSLIFRGERADIDVALTYSIFKKLTIRVYQQDQFIVKAGQHISDTLIILDGTCKVFGLGNRESLGVLTAGSHFGNDLSGDQNQQMLAKLISNQKGSNLVVKSNEDNFDNRSLLHLVANSFVIVGYIPEKDREQLYQAYPEWKKMLQTLNRLLFETAKVSLQKYCLLKEVGQTRSNCAVLLEEHLTFSTFDSYQEILMQDLYESQISVTDLTRFFKLHYINLNSKNMSREERAILQKACLQRHTNYEKESMFSPRTPHKNSVQCFKSFYILPNSKPNMLFDLIQLLNLIYIAFAIPLEISFEVQIRGLSLLLECISLGISLFVVILNFRKPIIVKGESTLAFKQVAKNYWQNGLLIDLCGLIPFNVIAFIAEQDLSQLPWIPLTFVVLLRIVRVISSWQSLKIFAKFEVHFKRFNYVMGFLKATLMLFFLGHFITCSWYFLNLIVESDQQDTWANYNSLNELSLGEKYLLCYYLVLNVVTSVGYGDMFPVNDAERIFFCLTITAGDVLFALAFGMITQTTMQKDRLDENQQFASEMLQIQQLMDLYNISSAQRTRIETYFEFVFNHRGHAAMEDFSELKEMLPEVLLSEIIFYQKGHLLVSFFKDFGSENLIKELTMVLQSRIFLPGDYIIQEGEIGEEMFFIVEGSVNVLAADKHTVVARLENGNYFGEIAILLKTKRTSNVQAETFCILQCLKKSDLDKIVKNFPSVAQTISLMAEKRVQDLNKFNASNTIQDRRKTSNEQNLGPAALFGNFMDDSLLSVSDDNNLPKRKKSRSDLKTKEGQNNNYVFPDSQIINNINNDSNCSTADFNRRNSTPIQPSPIKKFAGQKRSSEMIKLANITNFTTQIGESKDNNLLGQTNSSAAPAQQFFDNQGIILPDKGDIEMVYVDQQRQTTGIDSEKLLQGGQARSSIESTTALLINNASKATKAEEQANLSSNQHGTSSETESLDSEEFARSVSHKEKSFKSQKKLGKEDGSKRDSLASSVRRVQKRVRRLSRVSLGKNLMLSQTAGLKLQWTVGGD